jgi:hypothetical protein
MVHEFVQDSWLAIAGGRDIAHQGLPWHERLTSVAYGEQWIDQQWLGNSSSRARPRNRGRDDTSKVFASERYADWLLWNEPQLAGRLVYDVRFELFDAERFAQLAAFHAQGSKSDESTEGARLFVLDRDRDDVPVRSLARENGSRILYEDPGVVVLARHQTAASG